MGRFDKRRAHICAWLRERFPRQPYIYFGLSGATLLHEALKSTWRGSVVLPAFICPSISAMAAGARKGLIHVEADQSTLLPDPRRLDQCVADQDPSDTVVLIDHSFGYPFTGVADLRRNNRNLLIIEDCARSLGVTIGNRHPGEHSDWVLLSMYKTVLGSRNGAILLSKEPLPLRDGRRVRAGLRERAAGNRALRSAYDLWRRRHPLTGRDSAGLQSPGWIPQYGLPGDLCMRRFEDEILHFEKRASSDSVIAGELRDSLEQMDGIEPVRSMAGGRPADHFVSFRIVDAERRRHIVRALHRQGLFLSITWDLVPAHYACYAGTFPGGSTVSRDLAGQILHIPVRSFQDKGKRSRLIRLLRDLASAPAFSLQRQSAMTESRA